MLRFDEYDSFLGQRDSLYDVHSYYAQTTAQASLKPT